MKKIKPNYTRILRIRFKFFLLSFYTLLFFLKTTTISAQNLQELEKNINNTTYWKASTIARVEKTRIIEGLYIKKDDISELQSEFSKLNNIRYLKVNFENESDLLDIFNFARKLPNLNYILFDELTFYAKKQDSIQGEFKLPTSFFECTQLKGIKFSGNTKINLALDVQKFKSFPNLQYLYFSMVPFRFIPATIRNLHLDGLVLEFGKESCPSWLGQMNTLNSLSIEGNVTDYNNMFKTLANLKSLTNLSFKYLKILKYNISFSKLKNITNLQIESSAIENTAEFISVFEKSKKIENLEITRCKLDQIPKNIDRLKSLKKLTISLLRKQFQFPETLGKLTNLESIDLTEDSLMTIPETIWKLKHLKHLTLKYNLLTQIPNNIEKLQSLKSLDITHNKISAIPRAINQLGKLEEIYGQANPLQSLPLIGNMHNLKRLVFSYCDLQSLSEDIGKLSHLQELNLDENYIGKLPYSITDLNSLKILNLHNNSIKQLPSKIGSLSNLETLIVSGNLLDSIPVSIGQLTNLKELALDNNLLTKLPNEIIHLSSLQKFSAFSGTRYSSREIYRGKENNLITLRPNKKLLSFPKDLSSWKSIQTISLDGNDFSNDKLVVKAFLTIPANNFKLTLSKCNIDSLPNGWANFRGLALDLSRNNIKTLPHDMINAPYLSELILTHNQLPTSPSNLNSFSESRYEVLIYYAEAGLISLQQLPHNDSMVSALVKKAYQYYNYDKNYVKCVELFNTAMSINRTTTLSQINNQAIGESQYHVGNYREAILYLTKSIQRDTAGPFRILNFILPDFDYRAKSYLGLKDTLHAISDYILLGKNYESGYLGDAGILYKKMGNEKKAKSIFLDAAKLESGDVNSNTFIQKDSPEQIKQLSALELYIISEDFVAAKAYSDKIQYDIKETSLIPIYKYLVECLQIIRTTDTKYQTTFSPNIYKGNMAKNWGFSLFFQWLDVSKLSKNKIALLHELTLAMQVAQHYGLSKKQLLNLWNLHHFFPNYCNLNAKYAPCQKSIHIFISMEMQKKLLHFTNPFSEENSLRLFV